MERFRGKSLDGEWWLAEWPDDHFKGILQIDEGHRGTLTLRGSESQLTSLPCDHESRTFFGQIENEYIYEVSLFNTGLVRGPSVVFPKQPGRETTAEFYTNNILIGDHVTNEMHPFLNGVLLHLTGLEEWCHPSGFSGKIDHGAPGELATEIVNVSFEASASPYYDLGDGRLLRFLSQYTGPHVFSGTKNIALAQRNSIELVFSGLMSIKEILAEITIWQTFITFGLRRPSYIDEVTLLIHSGAKQPTRMGLIVPGRKPDPSQGQRGSRHVLFNQSKLGPNIASYLKKWRETQDDVEIAILLFSGAAYQDTVHIHTNLLTYLQALEILHRESFKIDRFPDSKSRRDTIRSLRAAVPALLDELLQNQIRKQLGYIGSLTLLDRLKHLFSLYPKSLTPLFRRGNADMELLKDTRNFLTHYGDQRSFGKEFLWSRTIVTLKEKARLFLEICLLFRHDWDER